MLPRRPSARRPSLRLLLALALTLSATALASFGVVPAPRAAAQAAPAIAIENLDKVPFPDRLVFQRLNGSGLPAHTTVRLRIKNTGGADLQVEPLEIGGRNPANFTLPNAADRGVFTIPAGGQRDIAVKFVTPDPEGEGTVKGPRDAILLIRANDPNKPLTTIELAGFNMRRHQGEDEPNLQEIIDTFGYATNVVNPNEGQALNPGPERAGQCFVALGDEVISSNGRWARADPSKGVYVRQLAAFSGGSSVASINIVGTGGGSIAHADSHYQTFLPLSSRLDSNGQPLPTEMTLGLRSNGTPAPGLTSFSVTIQGQSSLRCANDPASRTGVRFWAARDRSGALIPNTYIVGGDIVGNSATNYDYQDNVYLVTNIQPANASQDPNRAGPRLGSPGLVLNFDQTYANTLADAGGQRIGFPETQRNRNDITAILSGPSDSYDRTRLTLNTGGQGTLTVRSTPGTNAGTANNQVNGLCLPFDGRDSRFAVSTRLVGPFGNLTAPEQQAGLMFGPNQGNFVKLTVGSQADAQGRVQPTLQLVKEFDNIATPVAAVPLPAPATLTSLDLQLTADPATGVVEAGYRLNGGPLARLAERVELSGTYVGRFFDQRAKGCLLTSSRGAAPFDAVFDRFAVEAAPPGNGLPTVNAGPDQYVRPGATVALQGSAVDSNGAPLTGTWQQVGGADPAALTGDGNSRTFVAPNGYSVLTFVFGATDGQGRGASDMVTVVVGDEPITGLRVSGPTPVARGAATRFVARVGGGVTPISYRWDFGDGSDPVVGGPVVSHTFDSLGTYTVRVTATNAAGSASATTTTVVQTPVPNFAFRYDAGSSVDVTTSGVTWKADTGLFTPSSSPAERRGRGIPPIAGTEDDIIYQTYRGKVTAEPKTITYQIPLNAQLGLPAGTLVSVDLRLHFAELYWGGTTSGAGPGSAGKRIFDIFVEDRLAINNFDIYAAGKAERAVIVPLRNIAVTDGRLTLALKAEIDYAAIAGFEILRAPDQAPANLAPVVSAGDDQSVPAGTRVVLAATGSDPDGDSFSVAWSQAATGAPPVTLEGQGGTRSFTPATPGSYVFTVAATDSNGLTSTDSVVVNVSRANLPPTADAGPDQTVTLGATVTLSGTASDPEEDALTLTWSQVENGVPAVTLAGSGATRTFTPPAVGVYLFAFTARDAGGRSTVDTVAINVVAAQPGNRPPTAEAGPDQTIRVGRAVTLSGSGSDPEGRPLTYSWQQVAGPAATLAGSGATRTFTPSAAGSYSFSLLVTDEGGLSASDSVTVVAEANSPPVANAGPDQAVEAGSVVTLDGSASLDPQSDPLTFRWEQISGPQVTLTGGGTPLPRFTAPGQPATLVFRLEVSDGEASASDTVQVRTLNNQAPTARASALRSARVGTVVTLDGSASSDPEGDALTFRWEQVGGPPVTIENGTTSRARFTAPNQAGTVVIRLVVADGVGITASTLVQVTIVGAPGPAEGNRLFLPLLRR